MKKSEARVLVNLLAVRRIPFKCRRADSVYTVAFDPSFAVSVTRALGAVDNLPPPKRERRERRNERGGV